MPIFILTLGLTVSAAFCENKTTWKLEKDGTWTPVEAPAAATTQSVNEPVLDRAEALLAKDHCGEAHDILVDWEKDHKKSPARDRCIFLLARVYFEKDDRIKSFYFLDEVMDEYPQSSFFYASLEMQYKIAHEYLNGRKDTLLGMRIIGREDEAVEMMFRIQQRSPGSPLAKMALIETADYYFSDQQYDIAQEAYMAYVRSYPRSDDVPRVRLRAAFSSLAQFRGTLFDPTAIIDARAQLVDIRRDYPELAAEENVSSVIEQIDSAFAKKLLETAKFFEKTHAVKGAVYQYRFLAATYPNSPEADVARGRLKKMPGWALADPLPPGSTGYAPASTEPSGYGDDVKVNE